MNTNLTTILGSDGRIVIPVSARRRLGLKTGSVLTISLENERMVLTSPVEVWKELQSQISKAGGNKGKPVVAELLAERRAEAHDEGL